MDLSENYQFNYQKLLKFLKRTDHNGYTFAMADDYRFISQINAALVDDLRQKNVTAHVVFLIRDEDSLWHQIRKAANDCDAAIIANLYDVVNNTSTGLNQLLRLNFAREELRQLPAPLLFWADAISLNIISNQAPDLFSQRRFTTVHFTGKIENPVKELLEKPEWKEFIITEEFKETEARIETLKRRLADAEESGYNPARTAGEIALPLAKEYAELGFKEKAEPVVSKYKSFLDPGSSTQLAQLATVYHLTHQYDLALETMHKANEIIDTKAAASDTPEGRPAEWFYNMLDLTDWMQEYGLHLKALDQLQHAQSMLSLSLDYFSYEWGHDFLAVFKERQGTIHMNYGEKEQALVFYKESLDIRKELLENNQRSERLKRLIAISYNNLGDVSLQLGNLPQAKEHYEQSLLITLGLEASAPGDPKFKRDLTISYGRLGDYSQLAGNLSEASAFFEKGLVLSLELSKNNPAKEDLKRDVTVFYERLGDIACDLANLEAACTYYEKSKLIRSQLDADNPHNEQLKRDLAVSFSKLSTLAELQNDPENAIGHLTSAHSIFKTLSAANPQSQQLKNDLSYTETRLASLQNRPAAAIK